MAAPTCNDDAFGPISTCRSFDFTLSFENFICLLGSVTFVVASVAQVSFLIPQPSLQSRKKRIPLVQTQPLDKAGLARVLLAIVNAVFSAAILGLVSKDAELQVRLGQRFAVPSFAMALLAGVMLVPTTVVCRQKLPNSSAILPLYLCATVLLDACRLRSYTIIMAEIPRSFFALNLAAIVVKCVSLIAENTSGIQTTPIAPDAHASFLSRMTFWWLKDVMWTGFRRPLDMVHLRNLGTDFEVDSLGHRLQSVWDACMRKAIDEAVRKDAKAAKVREIDGIELSNMSGDQAAESKAAGEQATAESRTLLLKACFLAFPHACLAPIIPLLVTVGVQLSLPYLVNKTLLFAESQLNAETAQPTEYGWGLVGAYGLTGLIYAFANGQVYWLADKTQVRLRGALIDIIYRKSLRLHLSTANEMGGSISNLMAVDLERFCRAILPVHMLWSGLLQVILSAYLLYRQLGWTFISTLISTAICLAVPPILARGIGEMQSNWSSTTDKRVNLVSSAVNNAKSVKYMAYEQFVADRLLKEREQELKHGWTYFKRLLTLSVVTNLVKEFTALVTFTTLLLVDHITGSERFNINNVVTSMTLLTLMETPLLMIGQQYGAIVAALVSLRRIQAFLGKRERPIAASISPSASVHERQSYETTPTPSVGKSSFRAPIEHDDESLVAAYFHSASLGWSQNGKPVLVNVNVEIPSNALTIICGPIGSGKTTFLLAVLGEVDVLSGKICLPIQREPIAYVAQDGWLQENATIRDNITLQSAFEPELYQTVIYATALHIDLSQLDANDETLAKSLSGGQRQRLALARALYSQADSYVLDDFTSALDAETASHVWKSLMGPVGLLRNKTVIFATNALQLLSDAALVIRLQGGKVVETGRPQDLSQSAREAISRASIDESERASVAAKAFKIVESENRKDSKHEEVESGTVQWSVYSQWLQAGGVATCLLTFGIGFAFVAASKTAWQVYLQYFARAHDTPTGHEKQWDWLGGFIGLILFAMAIFPVVDFRCSWLSLVRIGRKLHAAEVRGVWNAPLSFFESRPPGVIVNRFSQDIFIMDWDLTIALLNLIGCIFELLGQMVLMVVPVPLLMVVLVIVCGAYFVIQRLYAPVSRQLRRLEMATKSPLYSQFSETSQSSGLATIRALGRQQTFIDINLGRTNRSQQPYFHLQAVRRWLLTWLNLLSLVVNVALVTIIVLLRNTKSIGLLGAGLITATQLSQMLNQTLVAYTEVEITSIALERILGFAAEPAEESAGGMAKKTDLKPREVSGKLELRDLSVTYPGAPRPALRSLNIQVKAGERIGVCGRSGSGKSTLLLAIFRMLEPTQGEVLLDDTPLDTYTAFSLRNSLTIVPQNPLVLTASVRENLDPLKEHDDGAIWDALEMCHLLDVVRGFPNGLDTELDANFNLSAGQRQLFNLTRALLRGRQILVLDEATSSMDNETDEAVQNVLRTQFKHCTIITVAHRIATVRDYDRILVLSNGEVKELDSPDALMARPDSTFRALAIEQGVQ
jgi:ABC-type multidrug transport system fused ATPase/permease subunit